MSDTATDAIVVNGNVAERFKAALLKSAEGLSPSVSSNLTVSAIWESSMIKSGALGELAAMKHFLTLGYEVYTAVTDSSTYDIILAKDGLLQRVEVKTTAARTKNNKDWVVQLKRVRPNKTQNKIHPFDSSRIDLLAVYITPLDRVMVFDARDLHQRATLSILD